MSEKQFLRYWYTGAAIVTAIVGVVAALLLAIISTAQAILNNARRALSVAEQIVSNTAPVWKLQQTNEVVGQLLEGAQAIEQHATKIADELEAPALASNTKEGN